jgi:hypothetical protein
MAANAHTFNVKLATELGLNQAIILQHFWFWFENNKSTEDRYKVKDHQYPWSYNTITSIESIFPYLKRRAIEGAIQKLQEDGYIIIGNFNKYKFDKTKWYSITDKTYSLFSVSSDVRNVQPDVRNIQPDVRKIQPTVQSVPTIPYSNPYSNPYNNETNNNRLKDLKAENKEALFFVDEDELKDLTIDQQKAIQLANELNLTKVF